MILTSLDAMSPLLRLSPWGKGGASEHKRWVKLSWSLWGIFSTFLFIIVYMCTVCAFGHMCHGEPVIECKPVESSLFFHFYVGSGDQIQALFLHSKPFTCWAISPALVYSFVVESFISRSVDFKMAPQVHCSVRTYASGSHFLFSHIRHWTQSWVMFSMTGTSIDSSTSASLQTCEQLTVLWSQMAAVSLCGKRFSTPLLRPLSHMGSTVNLKLAFIRIILKKFGG